MSRRMHHVEPHVADVNRVAVVHQRRVIRLRKAVLPVRSAVRREQEFRARDFRELATARDVVGVDVRLRDVRDPHLFASGRVDVLRDVAVGVDNDRLAGRFAADQVAGLCQSVVVKTLEEHGKNY